MVNNRLLKQLFGVPSRQYSTTDQQQDELEDARVKERRRRRDVTALSGRGEGREAVEEWEWDTHAAGIATSSLYSFQQDTFQQQHQRHHRRPHSPRALTYQSEASIPSEEEPPLDHSKKIAGTSRRYSPTSLSTTAPPTAPATSRRYYLSSQSSGSPSSRDAAGQLPASPTSFSSSAPSLSSSRSTAYSIVESPTTPVSAHAVSHNQRMLKRPQSLSTLHTPQSSIYSTPTIRLSAADAGRGGVTRVSELYRSKSFSGSCASSHDAAVQSRDTGLGLSSLEDWKPSTYTRRRSLILEDVGGESNSAGPNSEAEHVGVAEYDAVGADAVVEDPPVAFAGIARLELLESPVLETKSIPSFRLDILDRSCSSFCPSDSTLLPYHISHPLSYNDIAKDTKLDFLDALFSSIDVSKQHHLQSSSIVPSAFGSIAPRPRSIRVEDTDGFLDWSYDDVIGRK